MYANRCFFTGTIICKICPTVRPGQPWASPPITPDQIHGHRSHGSGAAGKFLDLLTNQWEPMAFMRNHGYYCSTLYTYILHFTYIHIHIYICICVYIFMYMYIYIHILPNVYDYLNRNIQKLPSCELKIDT